MLTQVNNSLAMVSMGLSCDSNDVQIVYGSQVTDYADYQAVKAVVDLWISQQATKKDFEAPKSNSEV